MAVAELMDFDVENWLNQARQGRAKLVNDKRELMEARNHIDEKIAKVDADIAKIDDVAGTAVEANGGKRVTGVQQLVRDVMRELSQPDSDHPERGVDQLWDEDKIINEVLNRDPMMKQNSIRSSLRTLVSKEEVERQGKRGSHIYRWASHDAEQPSVEDRIRNALANAGDKGVSETDLTWKAGDKEATGTLLNTLIEQGNIEKFPIGDGEFHYRIVSKEERQEEQKNLFGGAEQPPA